MSSEDFNIHIQKRSHKDKKTELKSTQHNGHDNDLVRTTPMALVNDVNSVNGDQLTISSYHTVATSSNCDRFRASSISVSSNSGTLQKLQNVIKIEQVLRAIPTTAAILINRMVDRCFHEIEIVALLMSYLNIFDSTFKVMPFGSATFGFGGSSTNLNILVNAGNQKNHIILAKMFKHS